MDKKLIFAGAFGLLFLGVLVWFLFFRKNPTTGTTLVVFGKKNDKPADTKPAKTTQQIVYVNNGGGNAGGNARNDNFPLKQGSYGAKVKLIQAKLFINADGDWGANTQAALVKAGIKNGFADQAAIDKWLNPTSTPDTTISIASTSSSSTNVRATVTISDYNGRTTKYGGLWSFEKPINVYQDADTSSTLISTFQPSKPVANNAFYGMGIVRNGFLLIGYGGYNANTKGWALISELTQIREKKWNDRYFNFDNENNQINLKKRY